MHPTQAIADDQEKGRGATVSLQRLLGLLVAVGLLAAAAVLLARRQFDRRIRGLEDDLLAGEGTDDPGGLDPADVEDCLAPVRRYFETVLRPGQPMVETVRIEQRGAFRLGGPDGDWHSLLAIQHCRRDPPGFVWDARIQLAPLLSARVLDCYVGGAGRLRARLGGVVPVASAGPDPEMDEGELLRYLAEAVWYPTALLPAAGVEWEPIDQDSARARIAEGDAAATLIFHFDEDGLVEQVTGTRYRQESDDRAPWVGYFEDYGERNGRQVPLAGRVAWDLPDGESSYWRARIESIDHRDPPVSD